MALFDRKGWHSYTEITKHIRIKSFKEISYLNPGILIKDGSPVPEVVSNKNAYIVVRLVNHGAMHDLFHRRWGKSSKYKFVTSLLKKYPVVISSEDPLPPELEPCRYNLPEKHFHHVLAHAKLVVGESATVSTEAAVLGVPSIYFDFNTRGYITEIEKDYNLIRHLIPTKENLNKSKQFIAEIMQDPSNLAFKKSQQKLLSDKVNIPDFFFWFIENYPESIQIMEENPDYQYNFRY